MCGIIGIFSNENNVIEETYQNLKSIQHRGRDSYGFVFYNNEFNLIKATNKIQKPNLNIRNVTRSLAHTKYTTSYYRKKIKGKEDMLNVTQPFKGFNCRLGEFYLVHNGNIKDLDKVKELFDVDDEVLNDSHLLLKIIEKMELQRWEDIFNQIMLSIEGSFSIIILTKNDLFCFKDLRGYRPLCIGKNDNGFCIASESVGLGNYKYVKEIERGKIIKINNQGLNEEEIFVDLSKIKEKKCLFEYIYFLNKDSLFEKKVRDYRYNFGIELAKNELKLENAVVIGAPMTGIPSGQGFADYSGYQYKQILVKNKNAGRSFILKNDEERIKECKRKFLIENGELAKNKELFFIDDSLVRGNTLKVIIDILRELKPKKIHIRIASPKILNICNYGIDIPSCEELIMNFNTNEEYMKKIGIDSLKFLELENMFSVMGSNNFCTDCFKKSIDW